MQAAAWEAFIQQDPYLSEHRGEYARRGAVFLPMFNRADFRVSQEIGSTFAGRRNSLELRLDFLNFGNLLNKNWGISQRLVTTQPLTNPSADAGGALQYRLRNINRQLITSSLEPTAGITDVYRIQMSVRYRFN